ncbi:MAG: type II toxin-antitoxin system VapC family toxin [Candidatus Dormibacteraceae bacterium]
MTVAYFDTSAIVKLLVREEGSRIAREAWQAAVVLVAVTLLRVETRAALAAAHRHGRLTAVQLSDAKSELSHRLWPQLTVVHVDDDLVKHAGDLAEQESLRADNAVHLAAAIAAGSDLVVTGDQQLLRAAANQGLTSLAV